MRLSVRNLRKSGKIWENLGKSGKIWENLGKSGKIWELSKKFLRQFGINLGQFGIVLGYKETMYLNAAWTESRE
jgi:hypothetical protein